MAFVSRLVLLSWTLGCLWTVTPHAQIRFFKTWLERALIHLVDRMGGFLIIHAPVCPTLPSAIVA
jgi:hypothetical protein